MQVVHCLQEHPEELLGGGFLLKAPLPAVSSTRSIHGAVLDSQCEILGIVVGQHQARAQSFQAQRDPEKLVVILVVLHNRTQTETPRRNTKDVGFFI